MCFEESQFSEAGNMIIGEEEPGVDVDMEGYFNNEPSIGTSPSRTLFDISSEPEDDSNIEESCNGVVPLIRMIVVRGRAVTVLLGSLSQVKTVIHKLGNRDDVKRDGSQVKRYN